MGHGLTIVKPLELAYGQSPMGHGHGPWAIGHGPWAMTHGTWAMAHGPWPAGHDQFEMNHKNETYFNAYLQHDTNHTSTLKVEQVHCQWVLNSQVVIQDW